MRKKRITIPLLLSLFALTMTSCRTSENNGDGTSSQDVSASVISSSDDVSSTSSDTTTSVSEISSTSTNTSTSTSNTSSSSISTSSSSATSTGTSTTSNTSTSTSTSSSTSTTTHTSTTTSTSTSTSTSTVTSTSAPTSTSTTTSTSTSTTISGEQSGISINECDGYGEAAYLLFDAQNGEQYDAYYKKTSDSSYTKIDPELVRVNGTNGRVDVVGLSVGEYQIKVENRTNNSIYAISDSFNVYSQDRSGYAHFNNTDGVGAYKNDGTLKDNAKIIYVSDATKNTVTANINGTNYVGLIKILKNLSSSNVPVVIRFLDVIKTCQFNKITYTSARETTALFEEQKASLGGLTTSNISANTIKEGGINSYSDDLAKGITYLEGLDDYSKAIYSPTTYNNDGTIKDPEQYDCAWNNMYVNKANNVTIEGIGDNAGLFQWGLTFKYCNSIEIKNLYFDDYTEDACSFEGDADNINKYGNYFLHHCTFDEGVNNWDLSYEKDKGDGDGSSDIKNCHNVTESYNRFNYCHKTNLIGGSDSVKQCNITLHHNYYYYCSSRLPLVRQANIHIYNNYYKGTTSLSSSIRANAFAFIENNYYDGGQNPFAVKTTSSYTGTQAKAFNNVYNNVKNTGDSGSGTIYTQDTVSSRIETMTGSCSPYGVDLTNFDTNPDLFYFNSVTMKSDVTELLAAELVKDVIPNVSGSLKDRNLDYTYTNYDDIGTIDTVNVSYNLSNITSSTSSEIIAEGSRFETLLTPAEDYILPTEITVKVNGVKITNYTYDNFAGTLIIPAGIINGDLEIIAEAIVDESTETILKNITFNQSTTITQISSLTTPTSAGVYYYTDAETNEKNKLYVDNNILKIYDTSEGDGVGKTTWGYYIFDDSYNSGTIKYSISFENLPNNSKWNFITFLQDDGKELAIGTNGSSLLSYTITGQDQVSFYPEKYEQGSYTLNLIFDYDNNKHYIEFNGVKATIQGWEEAKITGLRFQTAAKAARSFDVSGIVVSEIK